FGGWAIGIFRQGIHALAKNGALCPLRGQRPAHARGVGVRSTREPMARKLVSPHPCAPPSGSPGNAAVDIFPEAKALAFLDIKPNVIPSAARDLPSRTRL